MTTIGSPALPGGAQAAAPAESGCAPILCVRQRDSAEIRRVVGALRAPLLECADGAAAIEAARVGALSCAIAPLLLPDMSAAALLTALHGVAPGLAVLMVADNPAVSEAVAVMRLGAHAVIDRQVLSTGLLLHLAPIVHGR